MLGIKMKMKKLSEILPSGTINAHSTDLKILSTYTKARKSWNWDSATKRFEGVYSTNDVECVIAYYKCFMGGIVIIKGVHKHFAFKWNVVSSGGGFRIWRIMINDGLRNIREGIEWDNNGKTESMINEDEVTKIELKAMVNNLKENNDN